MIAPLDEPTAVPKAVGGRTYRARSAPPAQGCDVVVVGAGFTGLSAALHLARGGAEVTVLEAREAGWGASGRCFGQIVPYAKPNPQALLARFPGEAGERIIEELAAGPDLVFSLIEEFGIDCAAERNGMLVAAHAPKAIPGLESVAAFWQARGARTEVLRNPDLADRIGSYRYQTALFEPRAGTIDPPALVRGLAAAAERQGAAVHEGVRVIDLHRRDRGWAVGTDRGEISCDTVILATNAYIGSLWPELGRSMVPTRMYQLVSAPLSDRDARRVLPARIPTIDTRHLFSGVRMRPDKRLHVSTDGPPFSLRGQSDRGKAEAHLKRLYPWLATPSWDEAWSGFVSITPDLLPRLHDLAPGLWAALGYSGRGIAFGTILGRELGRMILKGRNESPWFPVSELEQMPAWRLAPLIVRGLMQWYRMVDRWDVAVQDRRWRN